MVGADGGEDARAGVSGQKKGCLAGGSGWGGNIWNLVVAEDEGEAQEKCGALFARLG